MFFVALRILTLEHSIWKSFSFFLQKIFLSIFISLSFVFFTSSFMTLKRSTIIKFFSTYALMFFHNFIYSNALPNLTKFGLRGEIRTHDLRYLDIAARIELASIVSVSIALHYAKRCKTGVLPDCTTRRKISRRV